MPWEDIGESARCLSRPDFHKNWLTWLLPIFKEAFERAFGSTTDCSDESNKSFVIDILAKPDDIDRGGDHLVQIFTKGLLYLNDVARWMTGVANGKFDGAAGDADLGVGQSYFLPYADSDDPQGSVLLKINYSLVPLLREFNAIIGQDRLVLPPTELAFDSIDAVHNHKW